MALTSSGKINHRFCHASAAACSRRTTIKMTEERQSFFRVFRYFCFALLREFLLAIAPKGTKKSCPCIRPRLRRGPFSPPSLRGSPYKGHPWSFTGGRLVLSRHPCRSPLSATTPFTLLKGRLESPDSFQSIKNYKPSLSICQASRTNSPVRRPSVGVAQGDARQDAERGVKGQGRPFATAPGAAPEGGEFCEAKPGCRGGLLFGYFLLARQEKVTRQQGET